MSGEHGGRRRSRARERDVQHVDPGPQLEDFAGEIGCRPGARARPIELAGIGLRLGDQFGHGLDVRLRRNHECVGRRADHHDRDEVLVWIVGRLGVKARIDHVGARAHQQGIAIAAGARRRRNADIAAGAAAVLDDHRLAQRLAERGIDQPGRNVGSAAGGKAHDHGDLPLGIFRACNGTCRPRRDQNHRRHDVSQNPPGAREVRHGGFAPGRVLLSNDYGSHFRRRHAAVRGCCGCEPTRSRKEP